MVSRYLDTRAQPTKRTAPAKQERKTAEHPKGQVWIHRDSAQNPYLIIRYPRTPSITAYLNQHLRTLPDQQPHQRASHFVKPAAHKPSREQPLTFACPLTPRSAHAVSELCRVYSLTITDDARLALNEMTGASKTSQMNTLTRSLRATTEPQTGVNGAADTTRPTPRNQPARETPEQSRRRAPDITLLTGPTSATADQATTLAIRAARHADFPDYLHTGRPNQGLYERILLEPGALYIKSTKTQPGYFRVPISFGTETLLSELWHHYGLRLEDQCPTLGTPAQQAIRNRLQALGARHHLSRASDLAFSAPTPNGLDYLPYQRAGIAYSRLKGTQNLLIADEPGLGKTIQAVGACNAVSDARRILIIAPASLKINWQREFQKWDTKGLRVDRVSGGASHHWPEDTPESPAEVVIINFDLVEQHYAQLTRRTWDALIIDEAHALKSSDAKRTKLILGAEKKKEQQSMPGIPATRKVFLTGTPILNRPAEIWPLAHALDPDFFRDKYQFERRYCDGKKTDYGWNARGASNLKELQRELRARIMVRRQKSQVLKDLPPKTRQLIELDHPTFARANGHFAKLEQSAQTIKDCFAKRDALSARIDATPATDTDALARYAEQVRQLEREARVAFFQMSEVRKETALMKVPQVMDLIKTTLDNGKLILFCHHAEVVEAYTDALNQHFKKQAGKHGTPKTIATVTGKTPNDQRQLEADRFQEDPDCQVFIGTIQAAGTGLTLTSASAVLFAELDWVPGNMNQAEDRAHRIGQLDHVLIYHAVVEGTLDALMVRRLIEKQAVIDSALDDQVQATEQPDASMEDRLADWLLELAEADSDATSPNGPIHLLNNHHEPPTQPRAQ